MTVAAPTTTTPAVGTFTGPFSTMDGLQLCRATNVDVTCTSSVSLQQVKLSGAGAVYQGEVATTFPAAAPLDGTILTPAGISCLRSGRGIECQRGGHGFRIGDTSVTVLRGPHETHYDASVTADPGASEDLTANRDSTGYDGSVTDYASSLAGVITCDAFASQDTAQAALNLSPALAGDLDPDGNGLACEDLPATLADAIVDYGGVDLTNEAAAPVGSDGYWAETCPGGSCLGQTSTVNGLPRDTLVSGYTRADGTVVGSYYRSSP